MDTQVNGKKLHKDIAQIVINESSYELKINDSGLDFVKPTDESFITRTEVIQLTTHGAEAVPTGNWTLFYKTDRQVGSAYKEYTVTLKDQRELSSEKLETGTTINKPAEETVTLNAGTQESGSGTNALPFIIQAAGTKPEAQLIISCTSSGTTVHCTVTDVNTGISSEYNGNPANVPLGLNGENEKLYEVKYNTKGYGYNPTTLKTKYYKILKLHTVTFNANGGKFADNMATSTATALHGRKVTAPSTSPTQDGLAFLGWYKEEAGTTAWDFTNDAVTEDITLYAKWSSAALFIKSTDAGAWKKLKEEAATTSGVSIIVIEGEIKATTDSGNSGEITIGRNLTIQGKTGATTDKLNANGQNHRIFKVTGGKTLTLKNLTLKGGKVAASGEPGGGAIYAEGTLTMTDCTVTDNETDYGNGGGIYAESDLTMTRCTVSNNTVSDSSGLGGGIYIYVTGTHTMTNCTVTNNEAKYSHGGGIYAMGTLSMMNCTVTGNKAQSSGAGSGSGGGIYTTGNLAMTGGSVTGNKANSNGKGGGIYIDGNGSFTMTGVTVSSNTTVYGDGGGIYIAENGSLTMTDGAVSSNTTQHGLGGGIFVSGTSAQFTMKDSAYITPSSAGEENQQGKNDVYLHDDANIMLSAALTGTAPAARITVPHIKYDSATKVLAGTAALLNSEHGKFTVTPKDLGSGNTQQWEINSTGFLQKAPITILSTDSLAWKKLKDAVAAANDGDVFIIDGEIKATAGGNSGEIEVKRNITIQGKKTDRTDTLNANSTTTDSDAPSQKHRIFKVEAGKKLTLENLTLKNGKNNETDLGGSPKPNGKGGAIYSKGELEIRNVLITDCEAKYSGGGIYCSMSASSADDERKLVIKDTEVTSCKASDTNGAGGGVYIVGENCRMNVMLSDVKIKNNEADYSAAGLCLYGSHNATTTADSVVLTHVTLRENKLTGTSAVGGAGMVFATYTSSNAIKLKNCTVTKNESTTIGGGISLCTSSSGSVNGKLILEDSSVTENKAQNGGGIYVNLSNLVMKNTVLTSNTATMEGGGAIYAKGAAVEITDCTLTGNEAKTGGAICAENDGSTGSTVNITGGTIGGTTEDEANKATGTDSGNGFGGAVFVKGATVNINGCTLEGNKAKNGGGVYMEGGNCTLNGSLKNNKTTELASSYGGGIYLKNGTLTMKTGAEISGSEASVSGGGVYISARDGGAASFTMEGGTISGCKVSSAYSVDGGGVCVEVAQGSTGTANFIMQGGSITGCEASSGGVSGFTCGGGVCVKNRATFNMTGGSITGCKAVINDNAGTPESRGGGVYMENSTFNMSGSSSITGCTAESSDSDISGSPSFYGGGVYAAGSTATFTMKDSAVITPSSEVPSGMKRFNDVYLNSGAKITVAGSLTPPDGTATRITPATYNKTTQVLGGTPALLGSEHAKFTVTPKDSEKWSVNEQGKLALMEAAIDAAASPDDAWKKFKEAVKAAGDGAVITVKGEIKATNATDNSGEIVIDKDLTVKGKNGAASDILDANSNDSDAPISPHRIFKVASGKTLTLENLTLKGGKVAAFGEPGGGAIYAEGTLTMTDCTVTDNKTEYGNGGGICAVGTLTMTRCTVSNNTADDTDSLGGGGIYAVGTLSMTNCSITLNKTVLNGGGVYAEGTLSLTGCTMSDNKAQYSGTGSGSGGGIYAKGSCTMTGGAVSNNEAKSNGNGGGIYIGGTGSFTMTSGTVNNNKTEHGDGGGIYSEGTLTMQGGTLTGNKAVNNKTGGGVYLKDGTFTMQGSSCVTPSADNAKGNNDVYLANGKKITVDGALTEISPIARITPATYADGTVVVQGSSSFTLPSGYAQKFVLTPASDANKNWTLDDSTNNQLKLIDYGVFTIAATQSLTGDKISLSWKENGVSKGPLTITNQPYRLMLSPYITDIKLEAECSSSTFLKEWTLTGGGTPPSGYTVEYPNSTSVKGKTITAVFALRTTLPAGLKLSDDGKTIEEYTGTESIIDFNAIGLGFVEKIKYNAFRKKSGGNFTDNTTIQEVVLPNGLKKLGSYAFFDCKALKKVTIPSGFTGDIDEVFPGCTALEEYVIAAGNPRYCLSTQKHLCSKKKTASGSYDPNDLTLVSVVFKPSTHPILNITDSRIKEIKNMAAEFHTFTKIQISGLTALSKIYQYAFFKSGGGYEVTIDRSTPPELPADPSSVFVGANQIKVPSGSVTAYKTAWTDYTAKIVGY